MKIYKKVTSVLLFGSIYLMIAMYIDATTDLFSKPLFLVFYFIGCFATGGYAVAKDD